MAKSDWKWGKQTTDGTLTVYDCSYIDEDETLKKRGVSVRDIPQEGRQSLADLIRLDVSEFEDWINFINYSPDSKRLGVNIENVWLNSYKADWNWEKIGEAEDKTLAVYNCPGWKCTQKVLDRLNSRKATTIDIPKDAQKKLAKAVALSEEDIEHWVQKIEVKADLKEIQIKAYVPNVWICADVLRGGSSWNQFIGLGTWLGQIPSHLLRNKKVVYCKTIAEFFNELQRGKGKIWGMVLFAHGNSYGSITSGDPNDPDAPDPKTQKLARNQMEVMKILAQYKYKLSKIFMMQCFSGYRGKLSRNFQYFQSNQAKAIIEGYLRQLYGNSIVSAQSPPC